MYKIFTIFIAVIVTSCLAQRPLRFRNKRIPYEDDDYRDNNGDYDDDRPNDLNNMRPYDHHNGNRFNHEMNRQTQFDVGGGRDPPMEYGFRGFSGHPARPFPHQLQPQTAQQPQQQLQPQQQQQQLQPVQAQPIGAGYDGRAGQFGYNPYGQYTYNPYGWNRPGYYGWNRPASGDAWRGTSSFGLGFPFNLLGLGGGGSSAYRPWWSATRFPFGLF
ncbi:uncharacterized protein LOC129580482 [Sitodiplosis mosellana]|uniref:uncharacterized protein LOC129580482 n=1 Tax=Sitodiplosis mosellana TaxID=263140 RepID=UPI0024439C78|nr:uncharacterized protein LOC129580482 [Sitodiplosis mosellana]